MIGAGGVAVVAVAGVVALLMANATALTAYRTARAGRETVTETLAVSGNVQAVHQDTADFQVAGTVAHVAVGIGRHVEAGQVLATLDATTLQQAVTAASSTLAAARARLSENEAGETSTSDSSAGASSATSSSSSSSDAATSAPASTTAEVTTTSADLRAPASGRTGDDIVEADIVTAEPTGSRKPAGTGTAPSSTSSVEQTQREVVADQQTVDADSATTSAALADAHTACAGTTTPTTDPTPSSPVKAVSTPTTTPSIPTTTVTTTPTTTTPTTTTPTTTPTTTTPTTTPAPGGSSACTTALDGALTDERQLAVDEQALATAETTLARLLTSEASSSDSTGSTGTGTRTDTGSATKVGGSAKSTTGSVAREGTDGGAATTTATDSARQLASDQSSIDSDEASLIAARQSLAETTLTSPISGTVAAVDLVEGQSVTAGSATAAITVLDAGSFEVTTSLTSSQVPEVAVGDRTAVTVDGVRDALDGTVSEIGPVDTGGSSFTYPLTVALPSGSHGISAGSAAQLDIVLHVAHYALAVPTSAVHTTGTSDSYVTVLRSGRETRAEVTVGVVGDVYTQIDSGLAPGATVVLADASEAIPTSGSSTRSGSGFGGIGAGTGVAGGFGGGAGGAGGG